jgi:uncharacterized membrane protein
MDQDCMSFEVVKWIHIISSTILFGTGIGSAFYVFTACRSGNLHSIRFATRTVVIADWLFTTPSIVLQLLTGIWMVHHSGWLYSEPWITWALILFLFAGACWVPVVWIQIKMRDIASEAARTNAILPRHFWILERWWIVLGCLAFPAVAAIFYLMVVKPG